MRSAKLSKSAGEMSSYHEPGLVFRLVCPTFDEVVQRCAAWLGSLRLVVQCACGSLRSQAGCKPGECCGGYKFRERRSHPHYSMRACQRVNQPIIGFAMIGGGFH